MMDGEEKTMKKTVLLLMAIGLFAVSAVACGGSGVSDSNIGAGATGPADGVVEDLPQEEITDDEIDIVLPGEGQESNTDQIIAEYFSVTGKVESVEEVNGLIHVTIEDENGQPGILVLSDDTVFPFSENINVGDTVTGWYLTNAPMIAIWPTQYTIAVLAAEIPDGVNMKVDRFFAWQENTEGFLLSQDHMFAFRTDENTEIILANGDDFSDGEYEGRRIVVIYGISTRSIPEMATADKLIVLYESIVALG